MPDHPSNAALDHARDECGEPGVGSGAVATELPRLLLETEAVLGFLDALAHGVGSALSICLSGGEDLAGALNRYSGAPEAFTPARQTLAEGLTAEMSRDIMGQNRCPPARRSLVCAREQLRPNRLPWRTHRPAVLVWLALTPRAREPDRHQRWCIPVCGIGGVGRLRAGLHDPTGSPRFGPRPPRIPEQLSRTPCRGIADTPREAVPGASPPPATTGLSPSKR